jgi:hypothetical protein
MRDKIKDRKNKNIHQDKEHPLATSCFELPQEITRKSSMQTHF